MVNSGFPPAAELGWWVGRRVLLWSFWWIPGGLSWWRALGGGREGGGRALECWWEGTWLLCEVVVGFRWGFCGGGGFVEVVDRCVG